MVVGVKVLQEVAGRGAFVGLLFFLAPRNGKADDNAAEHSQNQGGIGVSYPRAIFVQDVVQAVVEFAFDAPVVSFNFLEILAAGLARIQAGDEMHGFLAHLVLAQNQAGQGSDLTG